MALGSVIRPHPVVWFFRVDRLGNAVAAVKPTAQIDHLAPFATKRPPRCILGALCLKRLAAGWTLELRHESSHAHHDDEPSLLSGFASFFDVAEGSFVSDFVLLSDLSDFLEAASFSAFAAFLYESLR